MEYTTLTQAGRLVQLFIGKPNEQIKEWVKQLNDNPLTVDEYELKSNYSNKSIWDLKEFIEM